LQLTFDDYKAIHDILTAYPLYADSGDFDAVGQLYARCTLYAPGAAEPIFRAEGAERFTALYRKWVRVDPRTGRPGTRHLLGNIRIDEDVEGARTQSTLVVFQAAADFPLQPIIAGTYRDRFRKIAGGWYLMERREEMDLVGNLCHHVARSWPPSAGDSES
jgi:SnoaL-like domain